MAFDKTARRKRIKLGIRRKVSGTGERPRLSVFKSNKAIYAQLIDDEKGHTLTSVSSRELGLDSNNQENAKKVGAAIAEKAKKAGIGKVVFDRGGYLFHGKVKALADGAREGGLAF